jgi:hypothetical protein
LFELIHGVARPLEYVLRPLRGSAAGVIIVFSVLLTLSARAGLFGIPLVPASVAVLGVEHNLLKGHEPGAACPHALVALTEAHGRAVGQS